jgi:hypothetical protein
LNAAFWKRNEWHAGEILYDVETENVLNGFKKWFRRQIYYFLDGKFWCLFILTSEAGNFLNQGLLFEFYCI